MTESLRILILEDNPADAELIQFELQEAGFTFISKVVMTGEDFASHLQDFSPDLILSLMSKAASVAQWPPEWM